MSGRKKPSERLKELIERQVLYKVLRWARGGSTGAEQGDDRVATTLEEAHVVSSLIDGPRLRLPGRHHVLLDIDRDSWLLRSSTEGHYHLYIDMGEGIPWPKYKNLLRALADCGVIEQGYADVSIARGHTDLRLPWVKKEDVPKTQGETNPVLTKVSGNDPWQTDTPKDEVPF